MSSNSILTRKFMGLDHRVWRVMIIVIVLSGGLLGYKLMDKPECKPVDFKIKTFSGIDSVYYTEEILSFTALSFAENIKWDFDDGSEPEQGTFVTHRYDKEGKYFIKVTVNSGCEIRHPITIKKAIKEETSLLIKGHDNTIAGVAEPFSCLKTANNYEWSVLDHPEYGIAKTPTVTYKFKQQDTYTIELILNNDHKKKYQKTIQVAARPEGPRGPKDSVLIPKAQCVPKKLIGEAIFKEYLAKVVLKQMTAADFTDYLGNGGPFTININNGKKVTNNFEEACKYLAGRRVSQNVLWTRLITIKNVAVRRNMDGCILSIDITY